MSFSDIIDTGETLSKIGTETQDFVIASHVLEHLKDPLGGIRNWIRVLKTGGIAFIIIPDMRFTSDKGREETTLNHLIQDEIDGLVIRDDQPDIHEHCWEQDSLVEMINFIQMTDGSFDIEMMFFRRMESWADTVFVLRKI